MGPLRGRIANQGMLNGVVYSNVSESILPARESVDFLTVTATAGKDLYTAPDLSRKDLSLTVCYCSVLDECWLTDFGAGRAKKRDGGDKKSGGEGEIRTAPRPFPSVSC